MHPSPLPHLLRPRLLAGLTSAALAGAVLLPASAVAADPTGSTVTVTVTGGGYPLATSGQVEVTPYVPWDPRFGDVYGPTPTVVGGAGYPVEIELDDNSYKFHVASNQSTWAPEFYDDAASLAEADVVTVAGQPQQITVDLAPQGAIVGQVLDDAGDPVPFADVSLYRASGPHVSNAVASVDGVFVAPAGPGAYKLRAYAPWTSDLVTEWYGDTASFSAATTITLPESGAGVSLEPIELRPGGSVAGRVTAPDGSPIDDVAVYAYAEGDSEALAYAVTDAAGGYRVDGLLAGQVRLRFSDDGGYRSEWYDDAADFASAAPVTVAEGAVTDDLDAVLAIADEEEVDGTAVTGRALDPSGKPLRRIEVAAYARAGDDWNWVDSASTDRFGRYVLDGIDRDTVEGEDTVVKLRFSGETEPEEGFGYVTTWSGAQPTLKRATSLTVAWGQVVRGVDLRLQQYGGLRGTVSASVPLDGASVEIQDADGRVVWSDELGGAGTWSARSLLPGAYRVLVEGVGYDPESFAPVLLAPRWWQAGNNFATATPLSVEGGSFGPQAVDVALTHELTAYDAPTISGSAVVGQVLRAAPGRWNVTAGTEYAYTWLRGATVVGRGPTYRPTLADAGSALRVRVDALFWDWAGTSTSAATAAVKQVTRTSVAASYAKKKRTLALAVRVSAAGLVPTGSVKVTEGTKVVEAALVLKAGKATLVVKKPTRGRHTYTVTYAGAAKLLGSTGSVKVKV